MDDQPAAGTFWQFIRRGAFARLWWAGTISSLGDWIALFATLALAARIGGRMGGSVETAILVPLVARILPSVMFGPLFGVLADRWDRRKTMVIADLGRAVLVLGLLLVDDLVSLFVVSLLMELLTLMWAPAKEATLPNLVHSRRLVTANSLFLAAAYGTFPVGSAVFALLAKLGAALVGAGGPFVSAESLAFMVDSLTFLASAALIWSIPIRREERRPPRRALDLREPIRDLAEGLRFVASHKQVRTVMVGMATALFGGGIVIALGLPFAQRTLGADSAAFGVMITMLGTGAGLGMLAMSAFGSQLLRRDVVFGFSLLMAGGALSATALTATVATAIWWMFLLGLGSGAAYVMGFTHLHETVEDRLRGRTFGALITLVRTGILAALGVAGFSAALLHGVLAPPFHDGTRNMLFLGGVIIVAAGVGTLWTVRDVFVRPKLTPEALESFEAASRAFQFLRGEQRDTQEDEEEAAEE